MGAFLNNTVAGQNLNRFLNVKPYEYFLKDMHVRG
jgi:hypothetical protein